MALRLDKYTHNILSLYNNLFAWMLYYDNMSKCPLSRIVIQQSLGLQRVVLVSAPTYTMPIVL